MKKHGKILTAVIAVILAAITVFLAGCGENEGGAESVTTAPGTEQTVAFQEEITAVSQEETVAETAAQAAEETSQALTEANAPQTVEEIVEFFNKSANRIKPEASKVTKNYEKRIVDEKELVVPESLESTAKSMIGTFMKDDTEPIVYATREEINSEYIVPDQSYVSKLTPDAVASATCTDKGDAYEIYIKLKDEKNPTAGKGVGAVCDVIEASEVAEKASFVEEFTTHYNSCEIKVTVDKASGRVTHANYKTPLVLKLRVNLFGTHNAAVGLTFIKDYTINY